MAPGKDIRILLKMAGKIREHSSIGPTMHTYSHVTPAMQQEVADTMEALFGSRPRGRK